jgi:hypothetical protein
MRGTKSRLDLTAAIICSFRAGGHPCVDPTRCKGCSHGLEIVGRVGSAIKRTEVKRNYSLGPENQVFSPRTKPLNNTSNFFAFCLCLNISFAMSAYFAAPVSHQDLGRRSSPTVLRRPDNLRSHAMSKVLLQISWL